MRNIILLFFLFIGTMLPAQEKTSFTLEEAIHYAMDNSLTLKNSFIDISDAEERINENRAFGLPKVSFGVNYQYFIELPVSLVPAEFFGGAPGEFAELTFGTKNNLSASLEASTMVFDWSYFTGLRAAKTYRSFASQQVLTTQREVRNQVQAAYLPPLILEESKTTLLKNIANLERLLFETKELYKAGFVEQLDVDRLELSLANLSSEVENLESQKELTYNVLKFAMGYPMEKPISINDEIDKLLVDASEIDMTDPSTFLRDRPEVRLAQLGIELSELNVEYQKSTLYPSLGAFGQYQQQAQGDKLFDSQWFDLAVVGLQLNVPIFNGLGTKSKINRAKLEVEKAQNDLRQLERVINMEVGNARASYINAQRKVANQRKNVTLAQKIYDTTQIKYKEGVGSSLEITSAEQELFRTQQNLIQAKYDLLQAKMELDKALGKSL